MRELKVVPVEEQPAASTIATLMVIASSTVRLRSLVKRPEVCLLGKLALTRSLRGFAGYLLM